MNKFELAELLNDLRKRVEELESRFKIKVENNTNNLWVENMRLALGIDDNLSHQTKPNMTDDWKSQSENCEKVSSSLHKDKTGDSRKGLCKCGHLKSVHGKALGLLDVGCHHMDEEDDFDCPCEKFELEGSA